MNRIKTIFMLLFMTAGFSVLAQSTITSTESQITITGATTRENLAQLGRDLKEQGIVFKYVPRFDPQRHLLGLTFEISGNEGQLTGAGEHTTLSNPNAQLRIRINKTSNTCDIEKVGEASHN